MTFTGAAVYSASVFSGMEIKRLPLRPILDRLISEDCLLARQIDGRWFDCGTIERLNEADNYALQKEEKL